MRKLVLLFSLVLFTGFQLSAQNQRVSGTVTGPDGSPVAGVTVVVAGTNTASITIPDGSYSIDAPADASLEFSFLGMDSQTVPVQGRSVVNVQLENDATSIEDVVVVGYGTQRQSSITGSIATVNVDKMKSITSSGVSQMLQGKVAGVSVLPSSGQPGAGATIRIRGIGSVSANRDPLWVVDGVVGSTYSDLNPNDIQAISILKDGSASALYGSRGANGVVLITTKRGSVGTSRVDVNVKLGVSTLQRGKLRMMNSAEYYDYLVEAYTNQGNLATQHFLQPYLKNQYTDWWKYTTQNALTQNYNVGYTYGNDKVRGYISADYFTEEGTYKGFDLNRYTIRANTDYVVNKRLTITSKLSFSYRETFNQEYPRVYFSYSPFDTVYNSKGEIKKGNEGMPTADLAPTADPRDYWYTDGGYNSFYNVPLTWSRNRYNNMDAGLGFNYKLFDFLTFESNNRFSFSNTDTQSYTDPRAIGAAGEAVNGTLSQTFPNNRLIYANQLLRFLKTFGDKHEVSAFLAYEFDSYVGYSGTARGTDMIIGNEVLAGTQKEHYVTGGRSEAKNAAYFFNGNYAYDGKYLFDVSYRVDGSSRFGVNKRWAPFWSIGAGWNVHRENFMAGADWVDQLKLRASYGISGNLPSQAYAWATTFNTTTEYGGSVAFQSNYSGNKNLSWEQTDVLNAGLDVRLFDRVQITFDAYSKNVRNLIYLKHLSAVTGYNRQYANDGKMWNRGFEVTVVGDIVKTRDLFWDVTFNLGYNRNKVTYMPQGDDLVLQATAVGYPYLNWYMREWAGVDSQTGRGLWFAVDKETGQKTAVNDYNAATAVLLDSSTTPKFNGAIGTSVAWKNLSLDAFFTFSQGAMIYNGTRAGSLDRDAERPSQPPMRLAEGWSRWQKPGDIATHPQLGVSTASSTSSRYLERGDFFKLKTLSLAYRLPKKWLEPIGLQDLSLVVGGENLFTITEFSGIDPEVLLSNEGNTAGTGYSSVRRVTLGLNLKF